MAERGCHHLTGNRSKNSPWKSRRIVHRICLSYSIDGKEPASNTHSRGGAFWEELTMRRWASRHPPGTPLPIRYDLEHPNTVVPDAGDMPESGPQVPDDLKAILLSSALSTILAYRKEHPRD
jgi:hypothetical protein